RSARGCFREHGGWLAVQAGAVGTHRLREFPDRKGCHNGRIISIYPMQHAEGAGSFMRSWVVNAEAGRGDGRGDTGGLKQAIDPRVIGIWQKDMKRSSSMDAVADLVALSGLVRKGIQLVRGCEVAVDKSSFRMAVYSVLPIVKINEYYPLDASEALNMRRDLRLGKARGWLELTTEGMPRLHLRWDAPYAGEGLDEFHLVGSDELHVVSTITSSGKVVSYTSVHTRKA
ncbi:hypothetical protein VaNZ11_014051, partial [Volvox africanus]